MRIIITGTPGTGKSTIARILAKRMKLEFVSIKKIVLDNNLREKGGEVDLVKLRRALSFLSKKKDFIAEGHLACEVRFPADAILILRCEPKVLERRLRKRGYGKKKIEGNVMCELLDYCTQRTDSVYGKKMRCLELDTSNRSIDECVVLIEKAIKGDKTSIDSVKYDLAQYLAEGGD